MASRGPLAVAAGGIASLVLVLVITLVLAARADDPALGPEVVVTGTTPPADPATAEPSLKPQKTTKPGTSTVSPVQPPPPVPGGEDDDDGDDDDD